MTCLKVADSVRAMAIYSHDPTDRQWKVGLKVLQFLRTTRTCGLTFYTHLAAFVVSSFAGDENDRPSVSGGAVIFAGVVVSWFSRTLQCMAMSSIEAK
ncbi:unnamed protein product [Discosporangium mesarthrocarpum]